VREVISDPQVIAAGTFVPIPNGVIPQTVASPVDFQLFDSSPRAPAPTLGEHTASVLAANGIPVPPTSSSSRKTKAKL